MIKAWWFTNEGENFGDAICPFILNSLTEQEVKLTDEANSLASIGSILFYNFKTPKIIWGSGSISSFHISNVVKQHKVLAVRGPKSRKRLLDLGLECPEVYGDPSILFPLLIDFPIPEKKHEVSFLPHWIDYELLKEHKEIKENYNIIDIRGGVEEVLKQILESKIIISFI